MMTRVVPYLQFIKSFQQVVWSRYHEYNGLFEDYSMKTHHLGIQRLVKEPAIAQITITKWRVAVFQDSPYNWNSSG